MVAVIIVITTTVVIISNQLPSLKGEGQVQFTLNIAAQNTHCSDI